MKRPAHLWEATERFTIRTCLIMRLLIGLSLGHAGATAATFETEQVPSVEGEALVVFREGTDLAAARKKAGGQDATVKKAFRRNMKNRRQLCVHVRSEGKSTAELIASLEADPSVEFAEPNYLRRFDTVTPPANDPYFDLQWALQNTGQVVNGTTGTAGADIGWTSARLLLRPSSEEIVIAIVDSGIDPYHPDLVDHLWTNPGEIPGNQIDDDANGYVDDVHGYRFTGDGDNNIGDSGEHGTHVAGTIAAVANNGIGVAGVVPGVKLMILRVSDNGQDFSASGEIEAFEYLTMMKQRGVNVVAINGSYGGGGYSRAERNAIDDAGDEGIVFCAAAGNDSADNDVVTYYPAGYRRSNMIVVAATDQDDGLSSFSNYGLTTVDLAAPGRNIYSTRPSWSVATNASVQVGAASYVAAGIRYAGHTEGMTQSVHHCGLGYPEDFPPEVAGNIALIERGTLFFFEKVTNAMEAGAVAVIVYNNVEDAIDYWHLMQPSPWIPAVGISKADGEALTAALPLSATVVNSPNPSQWYKYMFGTSMATPHVTSAVAFAARNTPGENSAQRVARVLAGVSSAPELAGKTVTGGRLDLHRLVDATNNGLPDWWEVDHFLASPVDPSADVDGDLNDHLTEFLAGTDPLDPASRFTITSAQYQSGSPFQVTLPSISGRIYQLEQSTTLTAESWSSVGDPVFGSGSPVMIEVPASGPKQFYRVSVELSP